MLNIDGFHVHVDINGKNVEDGDVLKMTVTDAEGQTTNAQKDMQQPVISDQGIIANPIDCQQYHRGNIIPFHYVMTDDQELGNYNIEIHNNFDHHTHSTTAAECPREAQKQPQNPWVFNRDYTIPTGLRQYDARVDIQVPNDIDPGDYHFMIRLTDCAG